MYGRPLRLTLYVTVAAILALAGPALSQAEDEIGAIDPSIDPGQAPDPQEVQPDPSQVEEEVNRAIGQGTGQGGAPKAPAPPIGADEPLRDVGGDVVEALTENWAITAGVAAGLAGTTFAAWVLASRYIDPTIALRSPERSMLYGFIKGNPGVHLKQLSNEFTMKTSTVLWHVRKLEGADLIRSKKANGYRVFYPVSGGLEASQVSEAITALSNANARSIFAFVAQNPGAPFRALSEALPINPGTVRWHVKKLRKAGLLDELAEATESLMRPTELGLKAWTQVQGSPTAVQVPIGTAASESQAQEIEVQA